MGNKIETKTKLLDDSGNEVRELKTGAVFQLRLNTAPVFVVKNKKVSYNK